jgi:hypothetical protein
LLPAQPSFPQTHGEGHRNSLCSPRRVAAARVGPGWIEAGLVGPTDTDGLLHGIVDFEGDPLGTKLAVTAFLVLTEHCEGVE